MWPIRGLCIVVTSDWSALANITALVTQDHAEKMKALLGYNYPERERESVGARSSEHQAVNGAFCNILHV